MFSSTFDGEILNAAKAAERLIKARGETWESVIVFSTRTTAAHPRTPKPKPKPYRAPFQDDIDKCIAKANLLTEWERGFLISISERFTLSAKQQARFEQIKAKIAGFDDMTW